MLNVNGSVFQQMDHSRSMEFFTKNKVSLALKRIVGKGFKVLFYTLNENTIVDYTFIQKYKTGPKDIDIAFCCIII